MNKVASRYDPTACIQCKKCSTSAKPDSRPTPHRMIRLLLLTPLYLVSTLSLLAQQTVNGTITDSKTNEALISANVVVKGTTTGVTTDLEGRFTISLDLTEPKTLVITYLGYQEQEVEVSSSSTQISVALETINMMGQEVVVSSSRVSERLMESTAAIQKMNVRDIQEVASGDFYQSLGSLQGVDVTTSSFGFQTVNMRGFNATAGYRVVQFVDGMDNQAPGLNFPVGNMVGANDLDLESVEVITGAASALYGPNAFQGVISMKTKNPYDYPGLAVQVKGGSRNYADIQARYATTIGKNDRFGLKVTGQYKRIDDWVANDSIANLYGDIETEIGLSSIITQSQFDPDATQEEIDDAIALNNYLDFVGTSVRQGMGGNGTGMMDLQAPGYMESELADPTAFSGKASASLYYKFKNDIQASYTYKFGTGTAIYQGSNRYSVNNLLFQQHKLEVSGKNWNVKAYTSLENAGSSYDIVFTGINISKEGIADYVGEYLGAYLDTIGGIGHYSWNPNAPYTTDNKPFSENVSAEEIEAAHAYALHLADSLGWIAPGSEKFDSLRNEIINNADLQKGSKFTDASSLQHVEGQYNFDWPWLNVLVGANWRRYDPQSYGTIFADGLINPGDTLANGSADLNAKFEDISQMEYGGFIQVTKKFFNEKLKVIGSARLDKNENFNLQVSPRLSASYNLSGHVFRVSGQSAFRSPTLQNQYIHLDVGPLIIAGNLNGWNNLYTWESVTAFNNFIDSVSSTPGLWYDEAEEDAILLLDTIAADPIRPEQVKTIEFGYRGMLFKKLYIDVGFYHNWYTDFIGEMRVVRPLGDSLTTVGNETGESAIVANVPGVNYQLYQIPVNAKQEVRSMGLTVGASIRWNERYSTSLNYTWSKLITDDLDDPIIPGFNTPEHKINFGVKGRKVWKGLGFAVNFQWVDSFLWQSTFGDGTVPSYHLLDLQLSYELTKYYTTLRLGASNVYNKRRIEAYGSPTIGAMVYGSITFDIADLTPNKK